jgi:hypothetical protein
MSLIKLWNMLRHMPRPVVDLLLAIVSDVAAAKDPHDVAWRARVAAHRAVSDAALDRAGRL